ncbi:methylmalonyl Co-A mutase-associated GTPase MeaB [Psychrobacillus sp. NEAU-3TGS]|uniref:methylmalonyl Co-A mutase-associated GTPase MeaB n=1 Tax=Psychrobacillus sp. NEAU-3TGS TaxID=2995412 RepID=UPI00249768CC|nr:methylmalonyl Co-A mutase-associated GTPase MeaB [Psychrobacillus sp. NEAU-3TGS]MDI2587914.1 methylmalonyl Co-A mutase-associated GTPase MeaB [Psychrobacillus sp. NEAU-3TGS]
MAESRKNNETSMHVMSGIKSQHDGMGKAIVKKFTKKKKLFIDVEEFIREIRNGSRLHLAKAITFIESTVSDQQAIGQQLLKQLLPHTGNSIRIGITGVPGAGKSTFIEAFGKMLCDQGYKVAVLAIDPSSSLTGGSILGDKTRMEELAKNSNAFIRPSPSAGTLGGVHKKSRETMLLCEAAGYDVILVETVGVGQSETIVRGMVDFFLLLALTGAGDELQGMKKGIMELADAIVVNKADGANEKLAKKTVAEYKQILHFLAPSTPNWTTPALAVSSLYKKGLDIVWDTILSFQKSMLENGVWVQRRKEQTVDWYKTMIIDRLYDDFFSSNEKKQSMKELEQLVRGEQITVSQAVDELFSSNSKQ